MESRALLVALLAVASGQERAPERPRSVRIVATIDGTDELHLDALRARWVHLGWAPVEEVVLGGRRWNPFLDGTLEAKHAFAVARQAAERDPDFVPEGG